MEDRSSVTNKAVWLALLLLLPAMASADCKYDVNEADLRETRMFVFARGFNTGMSGHFGENSERLYLRGRYFSQFAATPSFDSRTPLTLTFEDGSTMTLPVLEGAAGELDWNPMLANNRETLPVFALESAQLDKIQRERIVAVEVLRVDKGEVGAKHYKVRKGAARKIAQAAGCIAGAVASKP